MAKRQITTALSPRQRRFAEEYVVDLNATQAALRAGYSQKAAAQVASRVLTYAKIQQAVRDQFIKRQKRTEITQDWVIFHLREIVLRSMQIIPITDDEGQVIGAFTFDSQAALRALELLGRHLGMWKPIGTEEDPLVLKVKAVAEYDWTKLSAEQLQEVIAHGNALRERLALPPGDGSGGPSSG